MKRYLQLILFIRWISNIKNVEINNYEWNIDITEAIDNILIDKVVEAKEYLYSSTSKKITECEECVDKSQCVDFIIKHMLGRHLVARALYDGWPPDRLHLLL